jgi:hypothetical protein
MNSNMKPTQRKCRQTTMTTNEESSIGHLPNAHEDASQGLPESSATDLNMNCDENMKPAQSRHTSLETVLWIFAIIGWGAIAYLNHMHPSFL